MDKKIKGFKLAINCCFGDNSENVLSLIKNAQFYTIPHPYIDEYKNENGLLLYTIAVYENLMAKVENSKWKSIFEEKKITNEDLAIVSLLHSLSFTYLLEKKDKEYKRKDSFPLGSGGERAIIMLLSKQIPLSSEQMYAIRWFDCLEKGDFNKAKDHPLCLALSEAVVEAKLK